MIRVLNVMEDGRIAGPQLRMLRVALELNGKIDTIIAIPSKPPFDFRSRLESADVRFVELPLTKLSRNPADIAKSLFRMPHEILVMNKFIKDSKIDVVHSSGGAWMFKSILAARLSNTPSVWHLNDTSSPGIFRLIARMLLKRWVTGVIVAGSRVKSHYLPDFEHHFKDKLKLISIDAPVSTNLFTPVPMKKASKVLNLITVGNINPVKDYLTVVRCASQVQKEISICWRIVGAHLESQSKYLDQVTTLIHDLDVNISIELVGAKENIQDFLRESDIYVCSSAAEASPTSVWEAMSCGLPVISTDVGCVSDHVKDGVNGFVVAVGDHQSMAARIVELGKSENSRTEMGIQNRKDAVINFDISVCASKHSEIYTYAASQKSNVG